MTPTRGRDVRKARLRGARAALLALGLVACGDEAPDARVEAEGIVLEASLEPDSPKVGANALALALRDAEGRPLEGADVEVAVRMHAMGAMPAMGGPVPVSARGGGRYEAEFDLTMGGTWQVEVAARPPGAALLRAQGALTVGTPGLALQPPGGAAAPPGTVATDPHAEHAAAPAAGGTDRGTRPEERAAAAPGGPPPEAGHPGDVALPPARVQEVGVRSARAELRRVAPSVRAAGLVDYDETALVDVALKVRGWVGALRADAVGVRVERGETLFTLYSPELYAAQEEYLQALRSRDAARGGAEPHRADWRVRAARKRLSLWDVGPAEIAAIERRGEPLEEIAIRAPVSGTVVEKEIVEGSAFEPGQRLLRIVPLDRVWIEAQVYESETPFVAVGTPAKVALAWEPAREIEGRVSFVSPVVREGTRTLEVRVVVDNPERALLPGMWASVRLEGEAAERLVVPQSAVLHAGTRAFVFLDLGGGRFRPREVEVGMRAGDDVEIARGLAPGDLVVASGTFLVASESRLRAALEQW